MRILILATPRSGSTSLVKLIDSHIKLSNHTTLIEPFNYEFNQYLKKIDSILNVENILIKNLFLIGIDDYPIDSFGNVYEYIEWCYTFFDKIILLDRKDKLAQSESFAINETSMRERAIGWHTPKIYDIEKIEPSYIKTMFNRYTESSEILHKISYDKKFPIFYYEDIFVKHNKSHIEDLFKYLDMKLEDVHYEEYVSSPYRKIRINKTEQKLL
jgi:hypothetical protein